MRTGIFAAVFLVFVAAYACYETIVPRDNIPTEECAEGSIDQLQDFTTAEGEVYEFAIVANAVAVYDRLVIYADSTKQGEIEVSGELLSPRIITAHPDWKNGTIIQVAVDNDCVITHRLTK